MRRLLWPRSLLRCSLSSSPLWRALPRSAALRYTPSTATPSSYPSTGHALLPLRALSHATLPRRQQQNKAEQGKAEQDKAEQGKAEQGKAEQGKAEQRGVGGNDGLSAEDEEAGMKRKIEPVEWAIYAAILAVAMGIIIWSLEKTRWKVFDKAAAVLDETEEVVEWMGGKATWQLPSNAELDGGVRMEVRWTEETPVRRLDYYQVEFYGTGPEGDVIVTVVMRRAPSAASKEFIVHHVSLWNQFTGQKLCVKAPDYCRRFSLLPRGEPMPAEGNVKQQPMHSVWYPDHRKT